MFGQARLLELHDVFAAAGGSPDEQHPVNDRGTLLSHQLCDHPAEREPEDVAAGDAQFVQEIQRMRRHSGDCGGHTTG